MSIHLSMNLLKTMLAATSDLELLPADDAAVKRVRAAGAPKELLEMYRVGIPNAAFVEMNGVRLYSIDGAREKNADATVAATLGAAGYFVFAATDAGAAYALDRPAAEEAVRTVVRFDTFDRDFESAKRIVAPSLDAFVFAFATNAIDADLIK